jgi:hypothetical protein
MDPSAHDRGGDAIFIVLGVYFTLVLAFVIRSLVKNRDDSRHDFGEMRAAWRKTRTDFASLRAAYRSERQASLGPVEAFSAAVDDVTGTKKAPRLPAPAEVPSPPPSPAARAAGIVYSLLVNAVSIVGVYVIHWTVATGLALYWAENVMTGVLLLIAIALWRASRTRTEVDPGGASVGEVAIVTTIFNGAHLVFLACFLGVILPRMDAAQTFDREAFTQGLALVAALLLLEFVPGIARIRRASAGELQRGVIAYFQRVVVVHLTIIGGMFALLLFGQPRTFFAVFAALKTVVDISRRLSR